MTLCTHKIKSKKCNLGKLCCLHQRLEIKIFIYYFFQRSGPVGACRVKKNVHYLLHYFSIFTSLYIQNRDYIVLVSNSWYYKNLKNLFWKTIFSLVFSIQKLAKLGNAFLTCKVRFVFPVSNLLAPLDVVKCRL